MGYIEVDRLVEPDSSLVEAIGYARRGTGDNAYEAIYVETTYGKVYEYLNEDFSQADLLAKFQEIVSAPSVGSAFSKFKKQHTFYNSYNAGSGDTWGEVEIQLAAQTETLDQETPVNEEYLVDNSDPVVTKVDDTQALFRAESLVLAVQLATVKKVGTLDDVLADASKLYNWINAS